MRKKAFKNKEEEKKTLRNFNGMYQSIVIESNEILPQCHYYNRTAKPC